MEKQIESAVELAQNQIDFRSLLDTEREQAVNQVVKNLGITTLLIAHRDSTVAMAGKRVELRGRD